MATVGLAAAGLAVGLGSAIGGAFASSKASKRQAAADREIAAQNLAFQRESRDLNLELFREQQEAAFGGRRDLILDRAGNVIEAATQFDPNERLAEFRAFLPSAEGAAAGGAQTVSDIFSGVALEDDLSRLTSITGERQRAFDLVAGERLRTVEAGRTAIDLGLENAIARINAGNVARGGNVGGTFSDNAIARAFLNAGQQKAIEEGRVRETNQLARFGITEDRLSRELSLPSEFRNLQFSNLGAPLSALNVQGGIASAPGRLLSESFASALRPVSSVLPTFAPPGVQPLVNTFQPTTQLNAGQIIAGGLGSLSGGLSDVGQIISTNRQNQALLDQNQAFLNQLGGNNIGGDATIFPPVNTIGFGSGDTVFFPPIAGTN